MLTLNELYNKSCEPSETKTEWDKYNEDIKNELIQFYSKENVTGNEFKILLDQKQNLSVKLVREVQYKPNQAIVYPANLFHSPNIDQEFTEDNPRVLLRITFDRKIIEPKDKFNYQ